MCNFILEHLSNVLLYNCVCKIFSITKNHLFFEIFTIYFWYLFFSGQLTSDMCVTLGFLLICASGQLIQSLNDRKSVWRQSPAWTSREHNFCSKTGSDQFKVHHSFNGETIRHLLVITLPVVMWKFYWIKQFSNLSRDVKITSIKLQIPVLR